MRSVFFPICLVLTGFLSGIVNLKAQPDVVATIRPLQFIAMAVTDGISEPVALFDGNQDPHHPSLRPSQRRAVNEADVLLWVGPSLETGLEKVVGALNVPVISAQMLGGMTRRYIGRQLDPHIWLDTDNARLIAAELTRALSELDQSNHPGYAANLKEFEASLDTLEHLAGTTLGAESFPSYAVYHDGFQYFEKQFGLSHAASFTSNEEVQPGIRRVLAIKAVLEEDDVNCIVVNPSVNTHQLEAQLEKDTIRFASVDLLARNMAGGKDSYINYIQEIVGAFASCRH